MGAILTNAHCNCWVLAKLVLVGATLGVTLYSTASLAIAQDAARLKLVAVLAEGAEGAGTSMPAQVRAEYARLGWIEGKTIRFDGRWAARPGQLPVLAAEIVTLKPDVVLVFGTPAALAMKRATRTIPVFFILARDPVESGLVASLARPGGNLTGIYNRLFGDKQLQLVKELVPRAKLVVNPDRITEDIARAARSLGVEVRSIPIESERDMDWFFAELARARADAVIVPPFPWLTDSSTRRFAQEFLKLKMPAVGSNRRFAEVGGLLVYTPKQVPVERAVQTIDQLLRGANPAEIPVESPTEFESVLNESTAKAFGLAIPMSIRITAREVIR